ncbi:hypothetical protein V1514DRAFT_369879 [Lipomyces japonicus]|uniref:uncharacterized protein n=1 Tax=Lipomyces japonicus TaxID=56871 RepID=UPI0034CD5F24
MSLWLSRGRLSMPVLANSRPQLFNRPARVLTRRISMGSAFIVSDPQSCIATSQILHPAIQSLMSKLDDLAPRFYLQAGQIIVIFEPKTFYQTLKSKILSAKKQVFLSSLYIGRDEVELIQTIRTALKNNPKLKVQMLTDALRGTREAPNNCSASMLVTLVEEFPNQVEIRMYHTPNLKGIKKAMIPPRLNEGWGLQHMKLYGFDDDLIISGANLSGDYFSNRQDRYYLFRAKDVTCYYKKIFDAISSLSYRVEPDKSKCGFRMVWPHTNPVHEPINNIRLFLSGASKLLASVLRPNISNGCLSKVTPTVLYPVSQFTPLLKPNISTESRAISYVLDVLLKDSFSWVFTAGYFNMYSSYKHKLLSSNPHIGEVITAAPEANGFFQSKGLSKYIPIAYSELARIFLREIRQYRKLNCIHLLEWKNGVLNEPNGWTYHAKGIWIIPPKEKWPSITVIGSSNFTRRSHSLDLETNGVIITQDEGLREMMSNEINNLKKFTTEMRESDFDVPTRNASWGVKAALAVVGRML